MATLVLTVVGGIVGGPIGAALGGLAGQAIDREVLFRPKGREGPRLTDLAVQTSSYGAPIARVYGRMRVAGSVIWATDLIESRNTESQGKGQPSATTYSYAASFAVLLSGRPIVRVGRIWAEGKLLRGATGDLKTAVTLRVHTGGEEQAADPLIASAEGAGLAPAHRGCAYAVLENLALADYGNRIPSLTFEVIAEEAPVRVGAIAADLGRGWIAGADAGPALAGYSAYGDTRAAIEQLSEVGGLRFVPEANGLAARDSITATRAIADAGFGRDAPGATGARSVKAIESVPRTLSLDHYDPARDYQAGSQRARRPGPGARDDRIELPAAISAGGARGLAVAALARREAERETRTLALGWDALAVRPGEAVSIDGAPGSWRVRSWSLERMVLQLDCMRLAAASAPGAAVEGRAATAADAPVGTTILSVSELPMLDDTPATAPRLTIAAAGTEAGWRRAALLVSQDGGASYAPAGATAAPAVIGTLASVPGAGSALIENRASGFEVELAHAGMMLEPADGDRLLGGANLAVVGGELLQFAAAVQLDARRWRVSRLWRGRRGTEAAIGGQVVGDRFTLLAAGAAATLDLSAAAVGATMRLLASGVGDATPVIADTLVRGLALLPLAPVHLRATRLADGGARVNWVRRSRAGWAWPDRVDAPLAEEREVYRVTVTAGGTARIIESALTVAELTSAELTTGAVVSVQQVGTHGLSLPAAITVTH